MVGCCLQVASAASGVAPASTSGTLLTGLLASILLSCVCVCVCRCSQSCALTQRTAMFRSYVQLHGFMDHTFMHDSSWVIRAFTSQGQDEEGLARRLRCSARSNSSFASCSNALFVKGSLVVFHVLERSSSPLCFVSSSGVHLRCALSHRAELISAVFYLIERR